MIERANVIWLNESDKNRTNVIYMLIFPNWKYYIGQTRNRLKDRILYGHSIISDKPLNKKERAVRKYKTFHVMILDNCKDLDELNVKERYWIELYDSMRNGYNSTTGGDTCKISDETRQKMSESGKGRIISDETRRRISESNKGKNHSDNHCQKISESNKGKTISDETRKKISESGKGKNLGKTHSDEHRKKISKTLSTKCKSIPDNILFDSIKQCVEYYTKLYSGFNIHGYLDNDKIHKKSGQTFVRVKD